MGRKPGRKKPTTSDKKKEAELARALDRASIFVAPEDEELDALALQTKLDESVRLYTQGLAETRQGMRLALRSTISFLRMELPAPDGVIDRLLFPLEQLELALADLDQGLVHRPLQPIKRRGGSKLTKTEAEFRLLICVCAELMIKNAGPRDEIYKDIAGRLSKGCFRRKRRDRAGNTSAIDADLVKGWHSQQLEFVDAVLCNPPMKLQTWFMRKAMTPFGLAPMQLAERPDAVVDHVFKHVLPLCFSHLMTEGKK